jgi:hypothetical protein
VFTDVGFKQGANGEFRWKLKDPLTRGTAEVRPDGRIHYRWEEGSDKSCLRQSGTIHGKDWFEKSPDGSYVRVVRSDWNRPSHYDDKTEWPWRADKLIFGDWTPVSDGRSVQSSVPASLSSLKVSGDGVSRGGTGVETTNQSSCTNGDDAGDDGEQSHGRITIGLAM